MTIAIAVRTSSTVVFAADSKLTTRGVVGIDQKGKLNWVDQTYDNATKVSHDRNRRLMVMVAGNGTVGEISVTDYVSTREFPKCDSAEQQNGVICGFVLGMMEERRSYWSTSPVPPDQWPSTTVVFAAPSPARHVPRTWRVHLVGDDAEINEVLTKPGLELQGSYGEVFGLLYGYEPTVFGSICKELRVKGDRLTKALASRKALSPLHKVNFWSMPVQDAIEFAVFLAEVQVQMDRFLPGTPVCGGPIDVLVLQMAPEPGIISYPGKFIHHPGQNMRGVQ
jgi:hypothetical protein